MKAFLFDTADIDSLKRVWGELKDSVDPNLVLGVTSNPAIMNRAGKNTLAEWLEVLPNLSDLICEMTGISGQLHVQFPNSKGSCDEVQKFVDILTELPIGCRLVLKLPPYTNLLNALLARGLHRVIDLNVTGLSDAGTLLKLNKQFVRFASLIPGRMEAAGLNYQDHLAFATQNSGNMTVITGALRNSEHLKIAWELESTPTVGIKTWDLIIRNKELDKLLNLEYNEVVAPEFMPPCDERHTKLSTDFFAEMDSYGLQAYHDFK